LFLNKKNLDLMEEITIPYHLAIPTIISIIGLCIIAFYNKLTFGKNKLLWTSVTVFFVLYLLIIGNAALRDIYYQWDLNRYDLDKNGMFGGKEITPEQSEAMQKLVSDTGRNFSFITGFIFAAIISTVVYTSVLIISELKKYNNQRQS
jgi:hypothetical protein